MRNLVALGFVVLIAACASSIPQAIRLEPANNPQLSDVQRNVERYQHQPVRWGGTIVGVRNDKGQSAELEILARPLTSDGEPELGDVSPGRFLARTVGFLDPEVYKTGRHITVYGTLEGVSHGRIGERDYLYPLVTPIQTHIWPDESASSWRDSPVRFGIGVGFGF